MHELKVNNCAPNLKDEHLIEVKSQIPTIADKIRRKMCVEFQHRMLSLMTDIGSRNDTSFLGVSVQYLENGKHITRSLGIMEIKKEKTAENIKIFIADSLKRYSIDMAQISAITTDNGSNMTKMVKDVNADIVNSTETECNDEAVILKKKTMFSTFLTIPKLRKY